LNFLKDPKDPTPHSVIAKGEWVKRDGEDIKPENSIQWKKNGIDHLNLDWEMNEHDMQFSMPIGMEMINDVIMKPYAIDLDASASQLPDDTDEAFLMLMDREGKWTVNTLLKGFTDSLGALASSYSNTGDLILIGKSRSDIEKAFARMKEIGGGIVLVDQGKILFELPLPLGGIMSDLPLEDLMQEESKLKEYLKEYGFSFSDPVYTLLFLSSMHLPYIRITPLGIMDVKKKEVLYPSIMR
ncbi:MAG: adenine deaminase C-terminal domain-containing protein, partial [Halobacillus sp.]